MKILELLNETLMNSAFHKLSLLGNVHIIRNTFGGGGSAICTVFCYEGGGGSVNPKNRVTYNVDVPLDIRTCHLLQSKYFVQLMHIIKYTA